MRYGLKPKASAAMSAALLRCVRRQASRYAPNAESGPAMRNTTLYAATGGTPARMSGVVSGVSPSNDSDSANALGAGANIGAFHHELVSGTACAFHHRIHVLSAGSPRSEGSADAKRVRSGHALASASAAKATNAQPAELEVRVGRATVMTKRFYRAGCPKTRSSAIDQPRLSSCHRFVSRRLAAVSGALMTMRMVSALDARAAVRVMPAVEPRHTGVR